VKSIAACGLWGGETGSLGVFCSGGYFLSIFTWLFCLSFSVLLIDSKTRL